MFPTLLQLQVLKLVNDYRITNGIWSDFIHDCNVRESGFSALERSVEEPFSVEYLLARFHSFDQFYTKFILFYEDSGITTPLLYVSQVLTHSRRDFEAEQRHPLLPIIETFLENCSNE